METSNRSFVPPSMSGGIATRAAQAKGALGKEQNLDNEPGPGAAIGRTLIAILVASFVIGMAWTYSVLFGGFNYSAVGVDEAQIVGAINLAFSSKNAYRKGNLVSVVKAYSQLRRRDFTPDGKAIYSPFRTRITVTGSGKATYAVDWHSLPFGACRYLLNSFDGPRGLQPTAIAVNSASVSLSLTSEVVGKACNRLTGNNVELVF
ncbi:hypothetical protein [Solirhodobacter olei]|uniref:hypothetical protein n=1 Tax=Solirhodobacter olei TaxID=2493082 RepID=UPI000FDCB463|nr:hypothetical protein [Solirhodobacter olei]